MGYRSNVHCVIGFADDTKFEFWVAKLKGDKTTLKGEGTSESMTERWGGCFTFFRQHNIIHFHHCDVKWYDSYPETIQFNEMLNAAEEFGADYRFIRAGEETDDIEVKIGGEGEMCLRDVLDVRTVIELDNIGEGEDA